MNSFNPNCSDKSIIRFMSGCRSPIAIFSAILPANNSICCGTVPTILRKLVFVTCAISNSPIRICPLCIGYICCINEISVVLPEPLSPITAVVLPFSIFKFNDSNTFRRDPYRNSTLSKDTSPIISGINSTFWLSSLSLSKSMI